MTDTPLHSVSVAGVTFDESGRVLLIRRRDNGRWEAPGGVLELEESFEEGVVREVLEETGVLVRAERLTGVYKNLNRGVVALVYRCAFVDGEPSATIESSETKWLDRDVALASMPPVFAIRVADAFQSSLEPASRAHDGTRLVDR